MGRQPRTIGLTWTEVRDAIADPAAWRRGRIVAVDDQYVSVVPESGPSAGDVILLESKRAPQVDVTRTRRGMPHPFGGELALWSAPARILAIPLAPLCHCGPDEVHIDRRAVIGQRAMVSAHRPYRFELIADDGTWTCALFSAIDTDAVARAADALAEERRRAEAEEAERAAHRPDRSVLGRWVRSSLVADDGR